MATVYGVNRTKNRAFGHQNIIKGNENHAPVRWMHDSYECSSTASGTVIELGQNVPAGAIILPASHVASDALGSSTAFTVGITSGGAELATVADSSNAAVTGLEQDANFGTELSSDVPIYINIGSASAGSAATGTIRLSLLYAMV